jgi:hypothetical protein
MCLLQLTTYIIMEGKFRFPCKNCVLISLYYWHHFLISLKYLFFSCFCSSHTDCIVTEDSEVAETFLRQVDRYLQNTFIALFDSFLVHEAPTQHQTRYLHWHVDTDNNLIFLYSLATPESKLLSYSAAVVHNASTRFSDGARFGLGAEVFCTFKKHFVIIAAKLFKFLNGSFFHYLFIRLE